MNKQRQKYQRKQSKSVRRPSIVKPNKNIGTSSNNHSRNISQQKIHSSRHQSAYQTLNLTANNSRLQKIISRQKCNSRASKYNEPSQRRIPIDLDNIDQKIQQQRKKDKYALLEIQYEGLLRKYYHLQNQVLQTNNYNGLPQKFQYNMIIEQNLRLKDQLREAYVRIQENQRKNKADQQYIISLQRGRTNDIEEAQKTIKLIAQNRLITQQISKLNQNNVALSNQKKQLEKQLKNIKQKQSNQQHLLKKLRIQVQRCFSQTQVDKKLYMQLQQANQQKVSQIKKQQQIIKSLKKEVQLNRSQIQQLKDSFQIQLAKIDKTLVGKDNIIRQLRKQIQQLTQKFDSVSEQKNQEIKGLHQKKRKVDKQLTSLTEQIGQLKSKISMKQVQIQQVNKQYKQLHCKYSNKTQQVDAERQQKQQAYKQNSDIRKQLTKSKIAKSQAQKQLQAEKQNYQILHEKLKSKDEQISVLRDEIEKMQGNLENTKKQIEHYRKEYDQIKAECQQQCRITEQLRLANLQFQRNQDQFTSQFKYYQKKMQDYQSQLSSYTPRYQALVARNQQLDQRNRQLSSMVNQAIQMQVDGYKKGILKDIQINANDLVQSIEKEQNYSHKTKRVQNNNPRSSLSQSKDQIKLLETPEKNKQQSEKASSLSKLASQKITDHKVKVSQSAKKLTQILEMKSPSRKQGRYKQVKEDYQYSQLNNKMERYQSDKDQVMKKINSFAEKLRIL